MSASEAETPMTDADRAAYWQRVAERALSRQREIYSELDGFRERAFAAEREVEFLRGRRGELVIERDTARDAASGLIEAIGNNGKTSSLHDWNERMARAVSDARSAIGRDVRSERRSASPAA